MVFCVWLRYKYGEKQKYLKIKLRMWSRLVRINSYCLVYSAIRVWDNFYCGFQTLFTGLNLKLHAIDNRISVNSSFLMHCWRQSDVIKIVI